MSLLYSYIIREYRNGKVVKDGWYFDRKYSRDYAIKYAKDIFKKNLSEIKKKYQKLLEEYRELFADEPYIKRPKKPNYRVVVYFLYDEDSYYYKYEKDGRVIAAWDSEYGRNGRMLTPKEKNQLPKYRGSEELF
jgi:hypothetical protein